MRNMGKTAGRPGITAMAKVNRRKRRRRTNKRWKRFVKRVNTAIKKEPKFTDWKFRNNDKLLNDNWRVLSLYKSDNVDFPKPTSNTTAGWTTDHTSFAGTEYTCTGYNIILRFFAGTPPEGEQKRTDLLTNTRLDLLILSRKAKAGEAEVFTDGTSVVTNVFKQDLASSFAGSEQSSFFSQLETGTYRQGYHCHKRMVLRAANKENSVGGSETDALEYQFFFPYKQNQKFDEIPNAPQEFINPKFDEYVILVRPQINGLQVNSDTGIQMQSALRMRFKDW